MSRVRLASCAPLPEPDPDEVLLCEALAAAGVDAEVLAWHDTDVDWSAAVPTVLRSTWNYYLQRDAFCAWAETVARAAPLWNPASVVRWNSHKRYLLDLEARGVPITPTHLLARGSAPSGGLAAARARGWIQLVIKPAVSAASYGTRRFALPADADAGLAHLAELLGEGDTLIQPYVDSVDDYGERSLVWIDGELTHAVRKQPRLAGGDESVSEALPIADDERALAESIIAHDHAELLYARIDLARDGAGTPLVMELELIEPSLFLVQHPPALERLASAIARRVKG